MNWTAAYCVATALNVKKKQKKLIFSPNQKQHCFFIVAPGLSVWNQTFLLMNVAAESVELFFFFKGSSLPGFLCVGREEEECMNPTTTSSLPQPFITQLAEGKGNWKVCSGSSADKRQTTCQVSCSCFVGQLICSSRLHESLCLPAMISEQSCIYNWMVIVKQNVIVKRS